MSPTDRMVRHPTGHDRICGMQIAAQPVGTTPLPGWVPERPVYVESTRSRGIAGAAWDAARGVQELGNGQPLTDVQIGVLTPFLAQHYRLAEDVVRGDLSAVRIYVGGAAAGNGGWAVTLGRDIYVPTSAALERMVSWAGRRWLVHELGHTMQWRRMPGDTEAARTRRFLWQYSYRTVVDAEGLGAIPRGTWAWLRSRLGGDDPSSPRPSSLRDAIHDAHRSEQEAERVAIAFRDATEGARILTR